MAGRKSTTSDDAGEPGADFAARLRQHEVLTREIYGGSLDELMTMASERGRDQGRSEGFEAGYLCGHADGYKRGHTDGYAAAKGRKKSRSRLTAKTVIRLLELSGQKDVPRFLRSQRSWPDDWPKQKHLQSTHSRQKRRYRELNNAAGTKEKRAAAGDSSVNVNPLDGRKPTLN
jgi:hypothetical protein